MAYQMTITLTDEEYAALNAEASRTGKAIETLLHERIAPQVQNEPSSQGNESALKDLYRKGILMNIATREPLTADENKTLQRLAPKLGMGQPISEIVIEDRGPRD